MKRRRSVYAPPRELSLDELMPHRDREGPQLADWSDLPDRRMLQSELAGVLDAAIRELPETYRPVLLLRDVEELSTSDTARILDLSEDVVRTRLHRARLAVRKKLDQYLRTGGRDGAAPAR
jgi:RNA polymerase sigma-70 factor (ECF subfamily)